MQIAPTHNIASLSHTQYPIFAETRIRKYQKPEQNPLMLKQAQATLDNNVLEDRSRGDINGLALSRHNDDGALQCDATAQVYRTSDGEMVKLNYLGDAGDALLEV